VTQSADGSFSQGTFARDFESFDLNVALELRRWARLRDKLAWFFGPRLGGGYFQNTQSYESRDIVGEGFSQQDRRRIDESDSQSFSTNVGFVIGADLELLRGLSVAFALRPAEVLYRWTDRDGERVFIINGVVQENTRSDGDSRGFDVDTNLFPNIYLALSIQ
jgi:hypothetical protein